MNDELRRQSNSFNWNEISFPTDWRDIDRFEKKNNISVNGFGWFQGKVYIARKTRQKRNHHVNLLLLKNDGKKTFLFDFKFESFVENKKAKK